EVRDRSADYTAAVRPDLACSQRTVSDVDGRLADAVHVDELRASVAVTIDPRLQHLQVESLAAEDHEAQGQLRGSFSSVLFRLDQLPKRRRRLVQDGDL